METAGRIRRLGLDKTASLATGTMTLLDVIAGGAEDEALRLAGAVEDASEHPIGQAIARVAAAPRTVASGSAPGRRPGRCCPSPSRRHGQSLLVGYSIRISM